MSGTLPNWIEGWLGIETQAGEGTFWSLEHRGSWLTLLLAIAAAALVITVYLREGRQASTRYRLTLAALRLAVVGIVLVMIAQLAILLQRTTLPYVAVLLDDSQSMARVDAYEEKLRAAIQQRAGRAGFSELSRWNLARTLLTERNGALLEELADHYKLRVYYLSEVGGARPSPANTVGPLLDEIKALTPQVPSTLLGTAVRTVLGDLRGAPPAAIILLTDGVNTEGPPLADAADAARRKGVPLLCVGLGDDRPLRELKLSDLLVDDVVFAGDVVNFEFKLGGTGLEGHKVAVVLRQHDQPGVLARLDAVVGPDGQSQSLRLPYRPTQVGRFRYMIEAALADAQPPVENARQEREIEVRKQRIRVLLVQAYPSFEFRYLRNMLARDETIELHTLLQDADLDHAEQEPTALRVFPVRRGDLFAYDVVILGDVNPALLGESVLRNLADFVNQKDKGGALALVAGPKYMPLAFRNTPLAALLPVDLATARAPEPEQVLREGFVARPTALGLSSPPLQLGDTPAETEKIWQELPPLYWMLAAPELKPAARVLIEQGGAGQGGRLPLVCMQYVGAGRVLFQATDETWRWRRRVGDRYFARYWVQMIRYLARAKLAGAGRPTELSSERREYALGEPVPLRVRFGDERLAPPEDDGVTVVLEQQGRKSQRIKLQRVAANRGLFEGLVTGLPAGKYHAWIAMPALEDRAPPADFTVLAPASETAPAPMHAAELQRAAEQTRGHFYTFITADRLLDDLPEGRQVPNESLPPKPLWNRWPLLLLALSLLTSEWLLRKRGGMV